MYYFHYYYPVSKALGLTIPEQGLAQAEAKAAAALVEPLEAKESPQGPVLLYSLLFEVTLAPSGLHFYAC
jgi:hypothetical protein